MQPLRKLILMMLAVLALAGAAIVIMQLPGAQESPSHATVMPAPLPLPDFELLDQSGKPFNRQSLRGRWSLVFFGFTHCPDICPATLQQLAIARSKVLAADRGESNSFPQIVFISVDPERDTTQIMRDYVANFGADIKGVSGDLEQLKILTAALGIFFEKSTDTGEDYNVAHSAAVLLIDPQAAFRALFSAPQDVASFVHDVPLLTGST